MGAFRNPNFIAEFTYRTKWNYYTMRILQERDAKKRREYEKELLRLEEEMRKRQYVIEDFYDVTQLLNSMIGLLIFPEQVAYDSLSKKEEDLEEQFPVLFECKSAEGAYSSNYVYLSGDQKGVPENDSPQNMLRHLRNAASHEQLSIFPENGRLSNGNEVIEAIVFQDEKRSGKYGDMKFQLRVPVGLLEPLLMEICDCILAQTK